MTPSLADMGKLEQELVTLRLLYEALKTENERLRNRNQSIESGWSNCSKTCAEQQYRAEKAEAENERLRAALEQKP